MQINLRNFLLHIFPQYLNISGWFAGVNLQLRLQMMSAQLNLMNDLVWNKRNSRVLQPGRRRESEENNQQCLNESPIIALEIFLDTDPINRVQKRYNYYYLFRYIVRKEPLRVIANMLSSNVGTSLLGVPVPSLFNSSSKTAGNCLIMRHLILARTHTTLEAETRNFFGILQIKYTPRRRKKEMVRIVLKSRHRHLRAMTRSDGQTMKVIR